MDREYIRQRGIRNRRNYKIKVVVTMFLIIALIAVCTIWVCKLIADSSESATQGNNTGQNNEGNIAGGATPTEKADNSLTPTGSETQNGENNISPEPTLALEPTTTPNLNPLIAIDAGHGGDDSGSRRSGHFEKDINIAIAKMVNEQLQALGYRTFMIREEDETVDKELRPGMAVEAGASLYVSIHQNAIEGDSNSVQGTEVWYNEEMNKENLTLATVMAEQVTKQTKSKNRGAKIGNGLAVLRTLEIPGCLVECGFISSEDELANLIDTAYQEKIATGIVNAICNFMPLLE